MLTHMTGNLIIMGDYSNEENLEYLSKFMDFTFNFDEDVQSIGFQLQVPHKNRLANIYLFDQPAEEVIRKSNAGVKIEPMGAFQLKLSHDGKKDIWPLF
jgi:hypothetical protein